MIPSYGWVGGGLIDYIVSFLGQVIVIVISRPRSLTIVGETKTTILGRRVCPDKSQFCWIDVQLQASREI